MLTAQGWIQKRLGDKVTIVEWAGACGLNADYFSRLFKAHTGMSPKAWLIEARLQRATRLLAAPDATVEKTAGLCGFDCPFHFSRTFKRRFGVPPPPATAASARCAGLWSREPKKSDFFIKIPSLFHGARRESRP